MRQKKEKDIRGVYQAEDIRLGISNDDLKAALEKASTKHRLAIELGVRYQTVLDWYRGAKPSPHYREAIKKYLEDEKCT